LSEPRRVAKRLVQCGPRRARQGAAVSADRVTHRVTQWDFRRASGAADIRGVCGFIAKAITLDNKKVTCKRCLAFMLGKP